MTMSGGNAEDDASTDEEPVDEKLQHIIDRVPGARLIQPDEPMPPPGVPQEDPKDVAEQREGLADTRRKMTSAERLAKAEECKAQGNQHFGNQAWRVSMVGYLAGIYFLKRGEPPCPLMIASEVRGLDEVVSALGAGTSSGGSSSSGSEPETDGAVAVRVACHLNLAAAALKISEWAIACAACEYVLHDVDATNIKALFRLAKAHEGAGDVGLASATVAKLLKHDVGNADARKLHEALKRRQAKEKSMFKGLFEGVRAEAGGEGLYTAEEEKRDQEEAKKVKATEAKAAPEGTRSFTGSQLSQMSEAGRKKFVDEMNAALDAGDVVNYP